MADLKKLIRRKKKRPSKYTELDYAREKQLRLQQLAHLSMFVDMTDHAKRERVERCENDVWEFARTYFPHYFSTATQAEWHQTIHEVSELKETIGMLAAPRGFAKSTILSFLKILWWICYDKRRFTLLFMETESKAEMQTWRILIELQNNERLINDFGKLAKDVAARSDFTLNTGYRLIGMGTGMSARGVVNAQYRPDSIILDDIEDRKLARNPARVKELVTLVFTDYVGATTSEDWSFTWIGSIICRGSALETAMREADDEVTTDLNEHEVLDDEDAEDEDEQASIVKYIFRAIERDENGHERSTWEERHPIRKLRRRRRIMKWRFGAEYQNEPQEEGGIFKESSFKHWSNWPDGLVLAGNVAIRIDPSYSDIGDCKAVGVGILYSHSAEDAARGQWIDTDGKSFKAGLYVINLNVMCRKTSVSEMIETVFDWAERYEAVQVRIEGTYAQSYYFEEKFAEAEMLRKKKLPLEFIEETERKIDRIMQLESDIERGYIVFPPRTKEYPDVETMIQQFTRLGETGMNDDGPDMEAGLKKDLLELQAPTSVIVD